MKQPDKTDRRTKAHRRHAALCLAVGAMLALSFVLAACSGGGAGSSSAPGSAPEPPPSSSASEPDSSSEPAPDSSAPPPANTEPPGPAADGVDPLTGGEAPEELQDGQRPLAVMVRNNSRALPQRGLKKAAVILEMPTEDGTTDLMALYTDMRDIDDVGPVGSIQDQFLQMALPLGAVPVFIGASQYARNLATVLDYKYIDGINQGTAAFWFDYNRTLPRPGGHLNEYSWYTGAGMVVAATEALEIPATGEFPQLFHFAPDDAFDVKDDAMRIDVKYSDVQSLYFLYNEGNARYYDFVNGDFRYGDDEERTNYENVFALEVDTATKEDSNLLELDMAGGRGWYFTKGGATEVAWQKGGPTDALRVFDEAGNELTVRQGKSYIGFVPVGKGRNGEVTWLGADETDERVG